MGAELDAEVLGDEGWDAVARSGRNRRPAGRGGASTISFMRSMTSTAQRNLSVISPKMANTMASSAHLQKTYLPVNQAAVELADEARKQGRRRIRRTGRGQKLKLSARES